MLMLRLNTGVFLVQTSCSPGEMLERRLVVLRGILESEEVYLRELEALLTVTSTHTHTLIDPCVIISDCLGPVVLQKQ